MIDNLSEHLGAIFRLTRTAAGFAAELRQSARRLFRSPGFAALAIGTLTFGIGINAGMFVLMDALLFRPPFQIAQPEQLAKVQFRVEGEKPSLIQGSHYPNFVDLGASGAFAAIAAYCDTSVSIGYGNDATLAHALLVSRGFFDVLRPVSHQGILSFGDGTIPEGGDQAVISHGFWQRYFGGSPGAIGAKLTIDGMVYSVGGVTPSGFHSLSARPVDVWLPLAHASGSDLAARDWAPRDWRSDRGPFWLEIVGRLASGTSTTVAEQQASAMLRNRRAALGGTGPALGVVITSVVPGRGADKTLESKVSLWLAGVSAFVLLIACANVSNLVLTRALARRREYFIRLSLGATRWDLVRRSLSDTCVIAIPGAIGALAISFFLRNAIFAFLSGEIPLSRHFWDVRTMGITAGSAAIAFLLVCAVSVSQFRSPAIGTGFLAQASYARNPGRNTRRVLLAVQAALCVALLFVAGLFARSLGRVESLDLGVDLDRTIQLTISLGPRSKGSGEVRAIYERARDILAKHPEVDRVTLAEESPYMSGRGAGPRTAERGFAELWNAREVAYRSVVGAGFFSTAGSRSLRGRDFDGGDRIGAEPVAIINAPLARYLWPSKDAMGECMWLDDAPACVRIVGVLGGVWKFSALKREKMAVYLPLGQVPDAVPGTMFIRPRGDAKKFLAQARSIVQSLHPDLPAVRAVLVRDIVDPEFRPWRLGATVFSAFAVVALAIASIGLYGVVTVSTALRLQEIGIRMALGACWPHVMKVVVGEGIASVASGLSVGAVLAMAVSRRLSDVLFETSPGDPAVLIQTASILLLVSAVAMTVPTIRALRTDPTKVLRLD